MDKNDITQIEDYRENVIQKYSPIDLSMTGGLDEVESFEHRDGYSLIIEIFKSNKFYIDTNLRNVLTSFFEKEFEANDVVTYETKEYRVVSVLGNKAVIRNSKRMINVDFQEIQHKNKELTDKNILHIYKVISSDIRTSKIKKSLLAMVFADLFEIDVVDLIGVMPEHDKMAIKKDLTSRL